MKATAIIQARCGSTRFPNKVFANLNGKPLIWHVVNRLKFASRVDEIVLATTTNPLDDTLEQWAIENNVICFRGSENDVLRRYYDAASFCKADVIVRITADDPFKEPILIDKAISTLIEEKADFVCNNNPPTYPEGLDVEVFTYSAISISQEKSNDSFEREHVTQYMYRHSSEFKMFTISNDVNLSKLRWTIDTDTDFEMVKTIYSHLYVNDKTIFHMDDILNFLKVNPDVAEMNLDVKRSAMY